MSAQQGIRRKAHFVGTKIKSLRKRNRLTLEDLSVRCIQIDAEAGPSVSYLSMIENGKRSPSERLLNIIAAIFQKELNWFFDEALEEEAIDPSPTAKSAVSGLPLEPSFLFSDTLLQIAIPELLAQTGTTGQQFAQLLIRSHQEASQNRFPDLERAAESIGKKRFPLAAEDVIDLAERAGIQIEWFDKPPFDDGGGDRRVDTLVRSFFEAPNKVYLNSLLKQSPERLKFDLANHIAHVVLHEGDGARAAQISGGRLEGRRVEDEGRSVDAKDILYAWRDFECKYFAAALLAPKTPFRQFLAKNAYAIDSGDKVQLTRSLVMRRMSSVSAYPYWHYFDAYPPGHLRAVYRGNGIPLPWGNMRLVSDPCKHWAVFRMLNSKSKKPSSQISVLRSGEEKYLYCCQSIRSRDAAGNRHVLCAGVDLAPALTAQNIDPAETIDAIEASCNASGGSGPIPSAQRDQLVSIGKILNIGWIAEGARRDATIICSRSTSCPRDKHCLGHVVRKSRPRIEEIRESLIRDAR